MKFTPLAVAAATAGLASAQFVINTNGTITCTGSNPNANYCASNSLGSNIIIRCTNFVGQAGNCNDNLAGEFPYGDTGGSLCWETSLAFGDANCEKNCVVYASASSFTLPATECSPSVTQLSSSVSSTSASITSTASSTSLSVYSTTGSAAPTSSATPTTITITYTGTTTYCPETGSYAGTTTTQTYTSTTTYCPESESSFATSVAPSTSLTPYTWTSTSIPLSSGIPTGGYTTPSNGTYTTTTPGGPVGTQTTTGSHTPVGPTTSTKPSSTVVPANSATSQKAGSALAVIGLVVAYFL